jgi:ribosomal protein S18 acetylase RimI-like enzyme
VQESGDPVVVRAIEENFYGFTLFGRVPGGEVHDESGALWYISGLPGIGNGVVRTHCAPDEVDARIEQILGRASARQVSLTWIVGPSTQPPDLGLRLEARGLTQVAGWMGMAIDPRAVRADVPRPAGLAIEPVESVEAVERWAYVQAGGDATRAAAVARGLCALGIQRGLSAGLPWRFYVGLLHGEPVATSALLLAAGAAGVHWVATLPRARGQGIGSAMTLAPLRDARALHHTLGVLKASEMGRGVYQRLGFQSYHFFPIYRWSGPGEATRP